MACSSCFVRIPGIRRALTLACAVTLGVGGVVAGATTQARSTAKARSVPVKLVEFKVQPKQTSLITGRPVKLRVKNAGLRVHELVVVRTNGSLPVRADGSVDEDAIPESDKIKEIAKLQPKKTKTVKVGDLPPGEFVFFCNLVDKEPDGTALSHYVQGMRSDFSVVSSDAVVSTTPSPSTVAPRRLVRREYPAGGPTDPVIPPGTEAYKELGLGADHCAELLRTIVETWNKPGDFNTVNNSDGEDTTPLYQSAAYVCLGRWDEATRTFGQVHSPPRFGTNGDVCARKAVLEWLTSLINERRQDPGFSPVFVASTSRSQCVASTTTSTTTTNPPTSTSSTTSTTRVSVPPTTVPATAR
jgi:hypothetical protein